MKTARRAIVMASLIAPLIGQPLTTLANSLSMLMPFFKQFKTPFSVVVRTGRFVFLSFLSLRIKCFLAY